MYVILGWDMVSMMDGGPQRTKVFLGWDEGGGGNRSHSHMARMPRKGGFISGKSFLCFMLFGQHKNRTFPDFSSVIFDFLECTFFKLGSPEFPPSPTPLPSSVKPHGPNLTREMVKKPGTQNLVMLGVITNAQTFSFDVKCHSILKIANSPTTYKLITNQFFYNW